MTRSLYLAIFCSLSTALISSAIFTSILPFFKAITRYDVDNRFTNAVKYGGLVFMSGQIGSGKTIQEQTVSALAEIDLALKKAGTDKSKILELTIWLSDMKDYDAMNEIYDKWLIPGKPPCRACLQAKLASPEYLIEIRAIAAS